jgi:hypothetical protein
MSIPFACYNRRMKRALILPAVCVLLSGCLRDNPEELDRLVKEDPAFKQMIAARNEAYRGIQAIKQDLLARKKTIDAQVAKLRGDHEAYARSQNVKIAQYHATIEASRLRLKQELETAGLSLERKQVELAGYQKTLADVKQMLAESKGITLGKAERQKWEERILMLSEKIRPLTEEIQELKLEMRLKRQKIGYLR